MHQSHRNLLSVLTLFFLVLTLYNTCSVHKILFEFERHQNLQAWSAHSKYDEKQPQKPTKCDFPDIESIGGKNKTRRWKRRWNFYFAHIGKTMGGTIFKQLPKDFRWKFTFRVNKKTNSSIDNFEQRCAVTLRNSTSEGDLHKHPAHTSLDVLLEKGILRCSDIDEMHILSIARDPWDRLVSICNWKRLGWSDLFDRIKKGEFTMQDKTKGTGLMRFKYDWNVTMFTMENTQGITNWFAEHGQQVLIDEEHHKHKDKNKKCKMVDLTEEQKNEIATAQWFMDDMALYQAVRDNGGRMRIGHGYRWLKD